MLKFSRPKGPGFGISERFYLTVLSARSVLPSIVEAINPDGAGGAPIGLGVPLAQVDKSQLAKPMERGVYAASTKDRKTIVKLRVISKEEANYSPEPFLRSAIARDLDPEVVSRMRATWTLLQLSFETHEPMVYGAVAFMLSLADRLAGLTDGVIADPVSQRYMLPGGFRFALGDAPIYAGDVVAVHSVAKETGLNVFTLGMQKFAMPEVEVSHVSPSALVPTERFLLTLCQSALTGRRLRLGESVGAQKAPFEVAAGGLDLARWEGIEVVELLSPPHQTADECVAAWLEATK